MTTLLADPVQIAARPDLTRAFVRGMRPQQWVKNALVLGAPGAAGVLLQASVLIGCLQAAASFTAVASGCYLFNDVLDRDLDRAHPVKRRRPVASGALPVSLALAGAGTLMLLGMLLAAAASWPLFVVVASYGLLTLLYSGGLKAVPWLEIAVVAAGFVLRAVAGATVANVPASSWFLLVVSAAAVLVAASKRSSERLVPPADPRAGPADPGLVRPVLSRYSDRQLRALRVSAGFVLVLSYAGWVLARPMDLAGLFAALSTGPVVAVTVRWTRQTDHGDTGAPEQVVLRDRVMGAGVLLWLVLFAASVLVPVLPW